MLRTTTLRCCMVLGLAFTVTGAPAAQLRDSAFIAMEALGTHTFHDLPDGGRIQLTREPNDSAGVSEVRAHLAAIARAFADGDFTIPGVVHAGKQVPGTDQMRAQRKHIVYRYRPLLGGGEVRILTRDPESLKAIHQYLAFQRREHHRQHGAWSKP